jgi:hypothetical protein
VGHSLARGRVLVAMSQLTGEPKEGKINLDFLYSFSLNIETYLNRGKIVSGVRKIYFFEIY